MADWLNIAGGAGKGYVQGQEDLQRKAEFDAMQRQRLRVEKQQQMDDELQKTLKGLRPPGSYTDTDSSPEAGAEGPPSPTVQASRPVTQTKISEADYARKQADAFARSARPDDIARAAVLRGQAAAAEDRDYMLHQRGVQKIAMDAGRLNSVPGGHIAAANYLAEQSKVLPEDQRFVVQNVNGVPSFGVAGSQLVPITPEAINKAIVDGLIKHSSVEAYTNMRKLDQGDVEAAARKQTAEAATTEATWKTNADATAARNTGAKAVSDTARAHLIAANAQAARAAAATDAERYGPAIPIVKDDGTIAYMQPTTRTTKGMPDEARITTAPPGYSFMKKAQVLDDAQREAFKAEIAAHKAQVDAGGFKTRIEAQAAFDNILKRYGQTPSDGTISRLQAAGPQVPKSQFGITNNSVSPLTTSIMGPQYAPAAPAAPARATPARAAPASTASTPDAAAEQEVNVAEKALNKFGSRQRRDDPAGYAAAVKRRDAARAELDALTAKYAATQQTGPALTYRAP